MAVVDVADARTRKLATVRRRSAAGRTTDFDPAVMGSSAQLGASHLRRLAGQMQKHVQSVGAHVAEAVAASHWLLHQEG
jgi:hypothetical protein